MGFIDVTFEFKLPISLVSLLLSGFFYYFEITGFAVAFLLIGILFLGIQIVSTVGNISIPFVIIGGIIAWVSLSLYMIRRQIVSGANGIYNDLCAGFGDIIDNLSQFYNKLVSFFFDHIIWFILLFILIIFFIWIYLKIKNR